MLYNIFIDQQQSINAVRGPNSFLHWQIFYDEACHFLGKLVKNVLILQKKKLSQSTTQIRSKMLYNIFIDRQQFINAVRGPNSFLHWQILYDEACEFLGKLL